MVGEEGLDRIFERAEDVVKTDAREADFRFGLVIRSHPRVGRDTLWTASGFRGFSVEYACSTTSAVVDGGG